MYWKPGELWTTVNYVDGLQQGEEKWYYKTGALKYILNYEDGVEQ